MEATRRNDFTKGKMWRVILQMAIPMTVAQLVNVLYSIVDRMYIGHIPGIGTLALTGLGLTMPIISIINGCANLCGMGGGPLCSIARGEGKLAYAEQIMGNAFTLLIIIACLVTGSFLGFMRPILYLFGASDQTYVFASSYARIYILGTVFVMISLGMNSFINAQGFSRIGMCTVLLGAVVNIVLDPIFIFGLNMGISGAAVATVISQACSAVWAMRFLTSKRAILVFRPKNLLPVPKIVGRILALGFTGFVMGATTGVVQIFCNTQLHLYGGDLYVGVMTVINSVKEVTFMMINGLSGGAQPVLGYNYGARAYNRVKDGIRFVTVTCLCYAVVVFAVVMLLPSLLVRVFNNDPALVSACVPALRIYFCGFVFMSLQMAGQSIFVGLGKSRQAVFFSLLRKVIVVVPLVFILPAVGFGVHGVFLAEPVSDVIGGLSCYLTMYCTVYRHLCREAEPSLPQS